MSETGDFTVLLVDDDDVACEAVIRSFRKNDIRIPVVTAADGIEALEILRGEHPQKHIDGPLVVLLDLNMPRMNGFEFLRELRSDPLLTRHVVFVLTTSNEDNDRLRAYQEHIAGYMTKSAVGPQFKKLSNLLLSYKSSVTLHA